MALLRGWLNGVAQVQRGPSTVRRRAVVGRREKSGAAVLLFCLLSSVCLKVPAADVARLDLHPTYVLNETGQRMTYRLHIPPAYDGSQAFGLVVVLHGYGANQDSPFEQAPAALQGVLQQEADRHAFLVVAPAGYDGRGDYGAHLRLPVVAGRAIPHSIRSDDLALADVMSVIHRVMREYRIDRQRVYLMGNSMGMTGVLYIAQKYPHMWCAIGPSDGPPWRDFPVERLGYLAGAFFVNGANDHLALSADNRALAERVRSIGVDTQFVEVPNGEHGTAWYLALPAMFDFFDAHQCAK